MCLPPPWHTWVPGTRSHAQQFTHALEISPQIFMLRTRLAIFSALLPLRLQLKKNHFRGKYQGLEVVMCAPVYYLSPWEAEAGDLSRI